MLVVLAVVFLPFSTTWMNTLETVVIYPGYIPAAVFWPQGVHSDHFTGPVGITLMLATTFTGSAAFWTGVIYGASRLFARKRGRHASTVLVMVLMLER